MRRAYVVAERTLEGLRHEGDTATTKVVIDASKGCETLEQRVIRFAPGRSRPRRDDERDELLYVAAGRGALELRGESHALEPDTGAYVPAGEEAVVVNDSGDELVVVSVAVPASSRNGGAAPKATVRYADQPALPATPNREFRYLINQDAGCPTATQFVGVIPPGRPGMHSHTYDEVVYVIEGAGALHVDGEGTTPIAAGSCFHLPPLLEHAVENGGDEPMRILGVFHPSGDPASRAYEQESTNEKEGQ